MGICAPHAKRTELYRALNNEQKYEVGEGMIFPRVVEIKNNKIKTRERVHCSNNHVCKGVMIHW